MSVNDPRDRLYDTSQPRVIRPRTDLPEIGAFGTSQATLQRVCGLIQLGAMIVNGLIGLRFLLKLLASNPSNPFAALVYFLTQPFLAIFVGLTPTPSFQGIEIEFFDLIAILFYFILAWAIVRLLWILFARLRPS
jgi:hypothetical protein